MDSDPQKIWSQGVQNSAEMMGAAMQAGLKLQEESLHWWAEMMRGFKSVEDWQRLARTITFESIPGGAAKHVEVQPGDG